MQEGKCHQGGEREQQPHRNSIRAFTIHRPPRNRTRGVLQVAGADGRVSGYAGVAYGGALIWMWMYLLACDGTEKEPEPNLIVEDANNYSFEGEISFPDIAVAPATDALVDWGAIAQDIQCHDLDPTSIKTVALLRFQNLDKAETTQKINNDTLRESDLSNYIDWSNQSGATSLMLSDMQFFGNPVLPEDYMLTDYGTFLLTLATGDQLGTGIRAVSFITPTTDETNTNIDVPDPCGLLSYSTELDVLTPVVAPAEGPYLMDWSALTVDARGKLFSDEAIDQIVVGHYQNLTVADLEAQFLDLELLADEIWRMPVANATRADLSLLQGDSPFTSFTSEGLWILGLQCTVCANPAPRFLTVVQVGG